MQASHVTLQVAKSRSYSRPYVAEYRDPDSPDDSGNRMYPLDSRGLNAATKERGIGSSFR